MNYVDFVFLRDNQWYFWDEAYIEHGPFSTQEEAIGMLKQYCQILNIGGK